MILIRFYYTNVENHQTVYHLTHSWWL